MKKEQPKLARSWKNPSRLKLIPTRNGFGEGLVEAGKADKNVMVISADLTDSTRASYFKDAFPDRFVQFGVAEQAMAATAAGMALAGKTVFIASYAAFSPGRNWEQIRTTACLQKANVKIAGAHAGISVGPDGATHQMVEDIAITRVLPEMKVLVPCDSIETRKATIAAAKMKGPVYVRFARSSSPVFTTNATPFAVGKAQVFRDGSDLAIIACGPLVYEALMAAEELSKLGIEARVINNVSVKPMDEKTIVQAAKDCGAIVTIEEAQAAAGMGSAVCEITSQHFPVPVERMGMQDRFGESGEPNELLEHFGLTAPYIVKAAKRIMKKKK
ncbi:transketolase family protein [Candidatus Uhrbacteria bacterium]|jgi:transketolase|nr:transketolase family protein [Candidatus Uhrbacteria bacterium]